MKSPILCILMVLSLAAVCSAEKVRVTFPDTWQIKTGDNPAWADPDYDDSEWQAIRTRITWEVHKQ